MTTVKRIFVTISEKKSEQQMGRRNLFNMNQRRDVWNNRRRFGY